MTLKERNERVENVKRMSEHFSFVSSQLKTKARSFEILAGMCEYLISGLESGEERAKAGKSTARNITSKDIEVKGITFTPAKKFIASFKDLTFECDGITSHPLSASRTEEALTEYFASHQYMSVRDYATLCHCSTSTARRRIAEMLEEGKLERSGIARGLYKLRIENCASE